MVLVVPMMMMMKTTGALLVAVVVLVVVAGTPAGTQRALPTRARVDSCSCAVKSKPSSARKRKGKTRSDDERCA